jgi:hypothetical protein
MVAVLMLYALPAAPAELVNDRARDTLFDACPVIRFLTGRILGHVRSRPAKAIRQALDREPNPLLRDRLADLIDGSESAGRQRVQIWLQGGPFQ